MFDCGESAALARILSTYDPSSGCYRRSDGSLDACPVELETLEVWRGLLKCVKPRVVLEVGTYHGLTTCFLAAALLHNGDLDARVYSVDPSVLDHLWDGTELERLINYIPKSIQETAADLSTLDIDVLVLDSIHTYDQSSWELVTLEPLVREGGYILLHNSLLFDGVGRTVQHLYDSPRFEVTTFETPRVMHAMNIASGPVSMGCTFARKIRHGMPLIRDVAWRGVPEASPAGPGAHIRDHAYTRSGA